MKENNEPLAPLFSDLITIINDNKLNDTKTIVNEKINKFIQDRLFKVGLDEKFIELLKKSKGEIGGFFLLQCMKNKWLNISTDLDIFINIENLRLSQRTNKNSCGYGYDDYVCRTYSNSIGSKLKNDIQRCSLIEQYLLKKINYDDTKFREYHSYGCCNIQQGTIKYVKEYYLDKIKIQLIYFSNDESFEGVSSFDFIKENSDFEFVQNSWNGETLNIFNINSIQNEESKCLFENQYIVKLYRCLKYLIRGFKILDIENPIDIIILVQKNNKKYRFNLKNDLSYAEYFYLPKILSMDLRKLENFSISYEYKNKVYNKNDPLYKKFEKLSKNFSTETQKEYSYQYKNFEKLTHPILNSKYLPKVIDNNIYKYCNTGTKLYNKKMLQDKINLKQFFLDVLQYVKLLKIAEQSEKKISKNMNYGVIDIFSTYSGSDKKSFFPFNVNASSIGEANIISWIALYLIKSHKMPNKTYIPYENIPSKIFNNLFNFEAFIFCDPLDRISVQKFVEWLSEFEIIINHNYKCIHEYDAIKKFKNIKEISFTLEETIRFTKKHF